MEDHIARGIKRGTGNCRSVCSMVENAGQEDTRASKIGLCRTRNGRTGKAVI